LYLGSGLGLSAMLIVERLAKVTNTEAPLRRHGLPWLLLVILSGGGKAGLSQHIVNVRSGNAPRYAMWKHCPSP
jgi:hypothetical protein